MHHGGFSNAAIARRVGIGGGWVDAIEGGSVGNEVELDGLGSKVLRN